MEHVAFDEFIDYDSDIYSAAIDLLQYYGDQNAFIETIRGSDWTIYDIWQDIKLAMEDTFIKQVDERLPWGTIPTNFSGRGLDMSSLWEKRDDVRLMCEVLDEMSDGGFSATTLPTHADLMDQTVLRFMYGVEIPVAYPDSRGSSKWRYWDENPRVSIPRDSTGVAPAVRMSTSKELRDIWGPFLPMWVGVATP